MAVHPLVALKRHHSASLLRIAGVVGVAVGRVDGDPVQPEGPLALVLYVDAPGVVASLRAVPRIRTLAGELARRGWSLAVHVSGPLVTTSSADVADPAAFQRRVRPLSAGASLGTLQPAATGTLGLVVLDASGAPLLLGNAHVLDPGDGTARIVQPGPADGGTADDAVGSLACGVKLRLGGDNRVDAALIRPDPDVPVSLDHPTFGVVRGWCDRFGLGLRASRAARTTGLVHARVQAVDADLIVNEQRGDTTVPRWFTGQVVFERLRAIAHDRAPDTMTGDGPHALQEHGDSGGVWVEGERGLACAVSFGASADGTLSLASPFGWVAQILRVTVGDGPVSLVHEDVPSVEPLDEATVDEQRRWVVTAGEPWERPPERPCLPTVKHGDGERHHVILGHGTQLCGSSTGFTAYDFLVKYGTSNPQLFARVIAVGTPATGTYATQFPEIGEYWFYDPAAAGLLFESTAQVQVTCVFDGAWGSGTSYLNGALGLSARLTPSLLNLANGSWYTVTTAGTTKSWGGAANYTDHSNAQVSQVVGVSFGLLQGFPDTPGGMPRAGISSVNWFRQPDTGTTIRPLFTDAVAGPSSTTGFMPSQTLTTTHTGTWFCWPPPQVVPG